MKEKNKLMKIGSIVQIDNFNSLVMITGIKLYKDYDYIGISIYDNYLKYEKLISFNHNNIIQVYDQELEDFERNIITQTKNLLLNIKLQNNIDNDNTKIITKKRTNINIFNELKHKFKKVIDPYATAQIRVNSERKR